MATALSNETPLPREHSISPYCEGSPTCQRCGGWQCDDRTRRHSDITRPSTTIGWSRPHQSCPVAPRIRPATAVGWESKDERNWKEFDMSCKEKLDEMDKLDEMESTALESSTKLLQSSEVSFESVHFMVLLIFLCLFLVGSMRWFAGQVFF